jgi:hypothetical protein
MDNFRAIGSCWVQSDSSLEKSAVVKDGQSWVDLKALYQEKLLGF